MKHFIFNSESQLQDEIEKSTGITLREISKKYPEFGTNLVEVSAKIPTSAQIPQKFSYFSPEIEYVFWVDSDCGEECDCGEDDLEEYGCRCDAWIKYGEAFFSDFENNFPNATCCGGDARTTKYVIWGKDITEELLDITQYFLENNR